MENWISIEFVTPSAPIGFAHRGAPASKREENTLAAFERALRLGATGLESDIALTADGEPVLVHSGLSLRRGVPSHAVSLRDLYERCGADFDLALDMAQPRAAEAVVRIADAYGATRRLWLTYWKLPVLASWRHWSDIHLVYATMPVFPGRTARLLEQLSSQGIDALNVLHWMCRPQLVTQAHQRGLQVFAWGIRNRSALERAVRRGVDGVFCDDAAALSDLARVRGGKGD